MSRRISRWGAPTTYLVTVVAVGLTLVGVLIRSPDTRSNFQDSPVGYDRTSVALVGSLGSFEGLAPQLGTDPAQTYVQAGCANCHGLSGQGGTVGPDIWGKNFEDTLETVRDGDHGMPPFDEQRLTDEQVRALVTYLNGLRAREETSSRTSPGS